MNKNKNYIANILAIILTLITMVALLIYLNKEVILDESSVFAFNDGNIESVSSPQYKYPEILRRCWGNQFFFGQEEGTISLSLNALLETILGPAGFRSYGVLLTIFLTAMAAYWCMRRFEKSVTSSLLTTLFYLLCGWNFSFPTVGLPIRSFAMMWSLLSIGLLESARRKNSILRYVASGGVLGLAVSESPDVGLFFAISVGAYFFFSQFPSKTNWSPKQILAHTGKMTLFVIASLLIAYQVLSVMLATQANDAVAAKESRSAEESYLWATQWSLPKAETWSLIAPGFHGASSRSQESPYWGGMGKTHNWDNTKQGFRNFSLAGYAIGTVPILFISVMLAYMFSKNRNPDLKLDNRTVTICSIIALMSLMLAWGKHFPLYRIFYALPHMSSIRNPDKWLGPMTMFTGIVFAFALDFVFESREQLSKAERKRLFLNTLKVYFPVALTAIASFLYLLGGKAFFINSLKNDGYGDASSKAWFNAATASSICLVTSIVLLSAIWYFLTKTRKKTQILAILLPVITAIFIIIELGRADKPYVMKHSYKHIMKSNALTDFLDSNMNNCRMKIFPPQHPLLNNWRMTYLMAKGYHLFDPVSVRQMPAEYQKLFGALGAQPKRLWQIGSIRYFLCTPQMAQQLMKMNAPDGSFVLKKNIGATMEGKAVVPVAASVPGPNTLYLLEFTGAAPMHRFISSWEELSDSEDGDLTALQKLPSSDFNPLTSAILHTSAPSQPGSSSGGDVTVVSDTPAETSLKTSSKTDGVLLRSVRYNPGWKAYIDDKPAEVIRANYLFQAIKVPAGDHKIDFKFSPSCTPLKIAVTGRAFLILTLLIAMLIHTRQAPTEKPKA